MVMEKGKMIEHAPIVSFLNKPAVERLILNLAVLGNVKEFVADFGKVFVEDFVKDLDSGKDCVRFCGRFCGGI
ncbi:hypothetical protein V6N12_062274 [Hibiscus sabdariffa]|uniref:Uncharacterized protein n=1 Tax=Hibiscus sabdariffa TaxID=183260 RepID=A0ABR2F8I0_9ROSI